MRHETVRTSDLNRLLNALNALMHRGVGEEGMGLLHGPPGYGKTTAICYAVNLMRGVYLRAKVTWTVTTMLQALCKEMNLPAHRQRHPMLESVEQELALDQRPIIIDEADYLLRVGRTGRTEMLDALRDIYDSAQVPVMLVGMEEIEKGFRAPEYARFDRRMTERVRFQGLTLLDAQRVAGALCEVGVEGALAPEQAPGDVDAAGTLVEALHQQTRGNVGRLVIELGHVERFARANGLGAVALDAYARVRRAGAPDASSNGAARAAAAA